MISFLLQMPAIPFFRLMSITMPFFERFGRFKTLQYMTFNSLFFFRNISRIFLKTLNKRGCGKTKKVVDFPPPSPSARGEFVFFRPRNHDVLVYNNALIMDKFVMAALYIVVRKLQRH